MKLDERRNENLSRVARENLVVNTAKSLMQISDGATVDKDMQQVFADANDYIYNSNNLDSMYRSWLLMARMQAAGQHEANEYIAPQNPKIAQTYQKMQQALSQCLLRTFQKSDSYTRCQLMDEITERVTTEQNFVSHTNYLLKKNDLKVKRDQVQLIRDQAVLISHEMGKMLPVLTAEVQKKVVKTAQPDFNVQQLATVKLTKLQPEMKQDAKMVRTNQTQGQTM